MSERTHTHGLEELSSAVRYREYLFELMSPYCGKSILEVGAGHGDFIAHFDGVRRLVVSDLDDECFAVLRQRFAGHAHVDVRKVDVEHPLSIADPVDTVVAINLLEHIEDDTGALKHMSEALLPGGHIVIFVPAYPALYGAFDRAVGHFRRYTPRTLRDCAENAGLTVKELRPVNLIGAVAWWFAVRLGKRVRPRPTVVRIYDRILVPIVRFIERRIQPPFGQSLLCVVERAT
jgi:SAM-dependent methyltransferase